MEALDRVQIVGQNRDNAAVRMSMSAEGLELAMSAQDVGNAQESLDAKFEGTELTVAFNPVFLRDGVDADRLRRGGARHDRSAEAGNVAGGGRRRLPVPADAGAHVLSPAGCCVLVSAEPGPATSVGHLWLTDFRCCARSTSSSRPG